MKPDSKQLTPIQRNKANPFKAVIAIPPVNDFYFTRHRFSGLGCEILASLLKENGCAVQLFNFPLLKKKGRQLKLPQALEYLKLHIIDNEDGGLSFFTRYQHFGPSMAECADQVLASAPDIVFISCFAFCYSDAALELASHIRTIHPEITIAIGGAGVSAYPDFFIRNPHIDYALTGEAEVSIPSFLNALKSNSNRLSKPLFDLLPDRLSNRLSGVPNLYYKNNGKIIKPIQRQKPYITPLLYPGDARKNAGFVRISCVMVGNSGLSLLKRSNMVCPNNSLMIKTGTRKFISTLKMTTCCWRLNIF